MGLIHFQRLKSGDKSQVEKEEGNQTVVGLTLGGQRSWETAGQYEDERSTPQLDKPKICAEVGPADGGMRAGGCWET